MDSINGLWIGPTAALLAAFFWAAATLAFGQLGQTVSPVMLNLIKGCFAWLFLAGTIGILSMLSDQGASQALTGDSLSGVGVLAISGALGIGLGDTAYFAAINTLGARRALLLETLAPPLAALMAWIFLGEVLSIKAIAGISVTLFGIGWVISERTAPTSNTAGTSKPPAALPAVTLTGLGWAILATSCQAGGAVLSRQALVNTSLSPLSSSLIRLSAGIVITIILGALWPQILLSKRHRRQRSAQKSDVHPSWQASLKSAGKLLRSPKLIFSIAIAAFFATYLGIWLQQVALKYTATGIAQALLATSPIFVLPMVALLGERVSYRAIMGVAIAVGGVWLLLS